MNYNLQRQLDVGRNMMKKVVDKGRVKREFMVGYLMFKKLQSYRQTTVGFRRNIKPNPQYFGPYKVIQKIRVVAYKLL
jgi:hypothetical protein